MPVMTALATFWLIWWVVLFAVLPWGARSPADGEAAVPGTDPGAPALPRLGRKLIWTTVVAVVIFAAFYVAYTWRLVSLDRLAAPFHFGENELYQNTTPKP